MILTNRYGRGIGVSGYRGIGVSGYLSCNSRPKRRGNACIHTGFRRETSILLRVFTPFLLLLAVFLLYSCDNPSGSSATSTPSEKSSSPTTTVSGRITTPAGNSITTAQVWASTDPANKVSVDTTDGSYSLGVFHSGSFTLTAGYTGEGGNYKMSDPKLFDNIKAKNMDGQDIVLKYGHTTTVSGQVVSTFTDRGARVSLNTNNVTITLEVEGIALLPEVKTRTIGATVGAYSINDVAHNGTLTIKASYSGFKHYSRTFRSTARAVSHNINLVQ